MSSTPGPVMEFLGRIAYEVHQMKPLFPTYIHLLISAIFPIYTAAHASLARPSSAAPAKKKKSTDITQLEDEEISPTIETLSPSDAILFPILAGVTLTSLYFILKWLQDPALLNYYLGLYFAVVGLFFNIKFFKDGLATIRSVFLPHQYSYRGKLWKLDAEKRQFVTKDSNAKTDLRTSPLPGIFSVLFRKYNSAIWLFRKFLYTRLRLKFSIWKLINVVTITDTLDLTAIIIATPLVYYHTFVDKPWFLTNTLGFSFCYGSLQMTTPGTSWTGTLLLSALFFYDIYFVFFTPMMVTVATKLDVPIKLLFPRPDGCVRPDGPQTDSKAWEEYLQCLAKKRTMAMLGLGDIVIPGIMLAFALRFDLYLYYKKLSRATNVSADNKNQSSSPKKASYLPVTGSWGERIWTTKKLHSPELKAKTFPKTYFNASVVGYIVGMITTVVAMQITQHAQPALLYLVPGVLLSLWGVALVNGDFKALWNYSEVPEELKIGDQKEGNETKMLKDSEDSGKKAEDGETTSKISDEVSNGSNSSESKDKDTKVKPETESTAKEKTEPTPDDRYLIHFSLSFLPSTTQHQSKQTKHQSKTTTQIDGTKPTTLKLTPTTTSDSNASISTSDSDLDSDTDSESWAGSSDDNDHDDQTRRSRSTEQRRGSVGAKRQAEVLKSETSRVQSEDNEHQELENDNGNDNSTVTTSSAGSGLVPALKRRRKA